MSTLEQQVEQLLGDIKDRWPKLQTSDLAEIKSTLQTTLQKRLGSADLESETARENLAEADEWSEKHQTQHGS